MKKLYTYIGRYWYGYLFAVFSMVTAIVLDMLYPKITQQIVDDVIMGGKLELLTKLLVGIVIVGIGRSIFGYCKEFTFDVLASKIGSAMRKDLFDHIQSLSMGYFEDTNTGELMARVKDDVDKIWNAMGYVGMLVIEVIIHVSMVLYCMFSLNWKLAFVPLVTMILCGTVAIIMERKLDKIYEDISEENAVLTTVAEENLAGVRTVKAFAREKHEIEKFLSHNNRYYELNISQAKVLTKYYPLFSFVGKVLPVCSTILGGIFVMNGEMTLGALVAFVEYSRNCTWPMEMLGWLTNDVSSAVASYKKIRKIYEEQPKIKNDEHPEVLDEIRGEICFDHADFDMDGQKILQDINVTFEEGDGVEEPVFCYESLKARGDIFEEFYYNTDKFTVAKHTPETKQYTVGDRIPVNGESYHYPDYFDIVILRDRVAVKVREEQITEILPLSEYRYSGVPVVNGRGFEVLVKSAGAFAAFLDAYEKDPESAAFSNRWTRFGTYREVLFHSNYWEI